MKLSESEQNSTATRISSLLVLAGSVHHTVVVAEDCDDELVEELLDWLEVESLVVVEEELVEVEVEVVEVEVVVSSELSSVVVLDQSSQVVVGSDVS